MPVDMSKLVPDATLYSPSVYNLGQPADEFISQVVPLARVSNVFSLDCVKEEPFVAVANLAPYAPSDKKPNARFYTKLVSQSKTASIVSLNKDYTNALLFSVGNTFFPSNGTTSLNVNSPLVFSEQKYVDGTGAELKPFNLLAALIQALTLKNGNTAISSGDLINLMKFVTQFNSVSSLKGNFDALPSLDYGVQLAESLGIVAKAKKTDVAYIPFQVSSYIYNPDYNVMLVVNITLNTAVPGYKNAGFFTDFDASRAYRHHIKEHREERHEERREERREESESDSSDSDSPDSDSDSSDSDSDSSDSDSSECDIKDILKDIRKLCKKPRLPQWSGEAPAHNHSHAPEEDSDDECA